MRHLLSVRDLDLVPNPFPSVRKREHWTMSSQHLIYRPRLVCYHRLVLAMRSLVIATDSKCSSTNLSVWTRESWMTLGPYSAVLPERVAAARLIPYALSGMPQMRPTYHGSWHDQQKMRHLE